MPACRAVGIRLHAGVAAPASIVLAKHCGWEEMMAATAQDSTDWLGLSGRVAVVTGGGRGIGRATAGSFAKAGPDIAGHRRGGDGLGTTPSRLGGRGPEAAGPAADYADQGGWSATPAQAV